MKSFAYSRASSNSEALQAVRTRGASFLAGGTNLIDLMKYRVEQPAALVDINHLALAEIKRTEDGGLSIGAMARNSDLANHPLVRANYPLLSQALLSGASPQLRNMASTGGNLMQRTRCYYFTDVSFSACNKRNPGSGCAALEGYNRIHAILGQTDKGAANGETCIAVHPSDMCVAMAALQAKVGVEGRGGKRTIPFAEFHRLPGSDPSRDTTLREGELITSVTLPPARFAKNAFYLKARDRNSYAFALISVAAGLDLDGSTIRSAGLAVGGVAHKPWRVAEAEQSLAGKSATAENFAHAADLLLHGAHGYEHNRFKIELAKQSVVRALTVAAHGTSEVA
ncbi:xanthine dehydrogenase YagS FAD-binding subunit [Granulicella rosea]|uniref:Xanthine dehydrogenase YagS FAD-binding subunit n=1 Tax=Granulicella rosea TaxID=474952 RepID=A0A239JYG7_9BACT|nr:xanthine dehydrogenase family protein subunit M [Granulicella rosea]SNT10508.1 xanthine dehydrogenase YagS FAD-binding subunit [Granulicella rosea]